MRAQPGSRDLRWWWGAYSVSAVGSGIGAGIEYRRKRPVMMTSALLAVFMLRDLGLSPRDYGLALGLPCLGGVAGSRLAPSLTRRFGPRRVLLASGL